jgi:hypothetical protein
MQRNGCIKPIRVWEIGYLKDASITYDPTDHANSVVKYLTIAASKASFINYNILFDRSIKGTATGLYAKDGSVRPAAKAFSTVVNKLSGATFVEKLNIKAEVWAYKFTKNGNDIYILWSDNSMEEKLPINNPRIRITSIDGSVREGSPDKVRLNTSPVIIESI